MSKSDNQSPDTEKVILDELIKILVNMNADWEIGFDAYSGNGIGPKTRLSADLDFTSINMAQLVVAIEKHFGGKELPFFKLFNTPDSDTDDICVADLVHFLHIHLSE